MKNMNENVSMTEKFKATIAQVASNALVKQANVGTRNSGALFISEPVIPIELLKEKAK